MGVRGPRSSQSASAARAPGWTGRLPLATRALFLTRCALAMLARVSVVAFNTYREAVRARVLHGLFALALATAGYSLVVGAFALNSSLRVVSDGRRVDLVYGIVVAVVLKRPRSIASSSSRPFFQFWRDRFGALNIWSENTSARCSRSRCSSRPTPARCSWHSASRAGVRSPRRWRSPPASPCWRVGLRFAPRAGARSCPCLGRSVCCWWARYSRCNCPDDRGSCSRSALLTLCEVAVVAAIATVFAAFFITVLDRGVHLPAYSWLGVVPIPWRGCPSASLRHRCRIFAANRESRAQSDALRSASALAHRRKRPGSASAITSAWPPCMPSRGAVLLLTAASLLFRRRDFL